MEQAVADIQSHEQIHGHHDGTVNSSGACFLQHQLASSWTGRTSKHTTTIGGHHIRQDKALRHDKFQGAQRAFCKYHHAESDEHSGFRFYQSEFSSLGNSLFNRNNEGNDSRTRLASASYRCRSPCRKFQSGTCYRGKSCLYMHSEVIECDKPTCTASVKQQQIHEAVRVPVSGEEGMNDALRISQGQEAANKENNTKKMTFSGQQRSRSPCHNFLRGRCKIGTNCRRVHPVNAFVRSRTDISSQHHRRYAESASNTGCNECHRDVSLRAPQGYDDSNLRTNSFVRGRRGRSPCRNFLRGKCYRGESCPRLHSLSVYDRTRYDLWITQQHDEVLSTSGSPHFNNCNVGIILRSRWDMKNVYQENQTRSTEDGMQLTGNRENMDAKPMSQSSERHKSTKSNDSGGDSFKGEPKVCPWFTMGRCNVGDSCRYLHRYHEYPSSNWSTRPIEAAADSRTFGVANQHANTLMVQQHDADESVTNVSKCEIPGEISAGLCSSVEGHEEISLWSRPSKRRNSRSRSPLTTPINDIHCKNFSRHASQYSDSHFYTFERPMYHGFNCQSSNNGENSINLCYQEKYEPKLMGPQKHEDVDHGLQSSSVSKNDETDAATLALQPSHMDQNGKKLAKDVAAVDRSQGISVSSHGDLKPDSATPCKEQLINQEVICSSMLEKEGNIEETNGYTAEMMRSMIIYHGKNMRNRVRKKGQGLNFCEENERGANTSKQQEYGNITESIKKNVEPALAMEEVSRRKLLVLDINGILADIVSIRPWRVFKRPFCDDFLQFCFERYDVGIWSSRTKKYLTRVVDFLMKGTQKRLLFCWNQSQCTATGYNTIENRKKPLFLKELKKLWDNKGKRLPWRKGYYNVTNTILLDDSPHKALRNPPYTGLFPPSYTFKDHQDKLLGPGSDLRVYLERLAEAENVQKFIQENPFGQESITKANVYWASYAKTIGTSDGNLPEEKAKVVGSDGIKSKRKGKLC